MISAYVITNETTGEIKLFDTAENAARFTGADLAAQLRRRKTDHYLRVDPSHGPWKASYYSSVEIPSEADAKWDDIS